MLRYVSMLTHRSRQSFLQTDSLVLEAFEQVRSTLEFACPAIGACVTRPEVTMTLNLSKKRTILSTFKSLLSNYLKRDNLLEEQFEGL